MNSRQFGNGEQRRWPIMQKAGLTGLAEDAIAIGAVGSSELKQ
jgi:hypothetical protein